MSIKQIVQLLIQERERLSKAIEALQGPVKRRGRPPKSAAASFDYNAPDVPDWVKPASAKAPAKAVAPKKRTMSAAGRKAIADAVKRRWAAVKAAKAGGTAATPGTATAKASVAPKRSSARSAAYRKMMSAKMKEAWAKRKKAAA